MDLKLSSHRILLVACLCITIVYTKDEYTYIYIYTHVHAYAVLFETLVYMYIHVLPFYSLCSGGHTKDTGSWPIRVFQEVLEHVRCYWIVG